MIEWSQVPLYPPGNRHVRFGPWPKGFRKTRGGQSYQNRWGILVTCLISRAVHIELVEQLGSSSFINVLKRFVAVRGPVQQYRCDRGTNFLGPATELSIDAHFVKTGSVGACRKILDGILLQNRYELTDEALSTFVRGVCHFKCTPICTCLFRPR